MRLGSHGGGGGGLSLLFNASNLRASQRHFLGIMHQIFYWMNQACMGLKIANR